MIIPLLSLTKSYNSRWRSEWKGNFANIRQKSQKTVFWFKKDCIAGRPPSLRNGAESSTSITDLGIKPSLFLERAPYPRSCLLSETAVHNQTKQKFVKAADCRWLLSGFVRFRSDRFTFTFPPAAILSAQNLYRHSTVCSSRKMLVIFQKTPHPAETKVPMPFLASKRHNQRIEYETDNADISPQPAPNLCYVAEATSQSSKRGVSLY